MQVACVLNAKEFGKNMMSKKRRETHNNIDFMILLLATIFAIIVCICIISWG